MLMIFRQHLASRIQCISRRRRNSRERHVLGNLLDLRHLLPASKEHTSTPAMIKPSSLPAFGLINDVPGPSLYDVTTVLQLAVTANSSVRFRINESFEIPSRFGGRVSSPVMNGNGHWCSAEDDFRFVRTGVPEGVLLDGCARGLERRRNDFFLSYQRAVYLSLYL